MPKLSFFKTLNKDTADTQWIYDYQLIPFNWVRVQKGWRALVLELLDVTSLVPSFVRSLLPPTWPSLEFLDGVKGQVCLEFQADFPLIITGEGSKFSYCYFTSCWMT